MLVDQHNGDILPLPGKLVESLLDSRLLGFGVDDQVVLLRIRCVGHMLHVRSAMLASTQEIYITYTYAGQQDTGH